jgi:DNA-binding CsgD family transcriptional regulator
MMKPDVGGQRVKAAPPPSLNEQDLSARVARLSERQRAYLELVLQHRNSKEIAAATGTSHRAVDKQLLKANNLLGVANRFEAARMLAAHDGGVEPLPPAISLPSEKSTYPLPPAWPTAGAAANMMTCRQVALWVTIIAIATPLGLTAAGMAIVTLLLLLGFKPL